MNFFSDLTFTLHTLQIKMFCWKNVQTISNAMSTKFEILFFYVKCTYASNDVWMRFPGKICEMLYLIELIFCGTDMYMYIHTYLMVNRLFGVHSAHLGKSILCETSLDSPTTA